VIFLFDIFWLNPQISDCFCSLIKKPLLFLFDIFWSNPQISDCFLFASLTKKSKMGGRI